MNTPVFRTSQAQLPWQWPVDLARYDQTPSLSDQEKEAIAYAIAHLGSRSAKARAALLRRLVQPLTDILVAIGSPQQEQYAPILVLLDEMNRRGTTYWAWSADEWVETIGPTRTAFEQRRQHRSGPKARQQVIVLAYLLTGFSNFFSFASKTLQLHQTASTIFGTAQINAATQRIRDVLTQRGYSPSTVEVKVHLAIAVVFLLNRSPSLEQVTYDQLASLRDQTSSVSLSDGLGLLSLALTDLRLLEAALPRRRLTKPIITRMEAEGVSREWARWCIAWYERSPLSVNTKDTYLCHLRKVGLWLAKHHPGITSPEQWNDDLGFAFVSAVNEMSVGDYVSEVGALQGAGIIGKALMPRSKDHVLTVMRRFFSDLQEIPHNVDARGAHCIERCFNPLLVFETPRSIGRLIGPDPRVIDDAWWWKILAAATALGEEDLPRSKNGYSLYPLAMVQALAVTWCYSGLRSDELKRLRVGCIRWQWEHEMQPEEGERPPEDATCFLHVPVNKTGTAFWKPVYALVGTYIQQGFRPLNISASLE